MGEIRHAARKPLVAWSLTGSALVVLAAALVLLGLNASRFNASRLNAGQIGFYSLLSVGALAYAGAGGLIARRVPGNAIGWLLGLAGLSLTVAMLTEQYALYGLATAKGTVPAPKVAGVLSEAAVELTVILLFVLVMLFPDGRLPSPRWRPVLWALAVVAAGLVAQQFQAGIMISGGIKYRLYDLGRIVSRTVTYAIVTGLLVGIYAGLVLLATEVLTIKSPVAVAGATLAAAALFGPLRSRVQQRVDRRFNRARYSAERMLAAFAARLTEELDADAVTEDLARSVHAALEPAHVSIWLSE